MATRFNFTAVDAAGTLLEAHTLGSGEVAATFHKQVNSASGSTIWTAANKIRANTNGFADRYYSDSPDLLYLDATLLLSFVTLTGTTGATIRASSTDSSGYGIVYSNSAAKVQLYKMPAGGGVDVVLADSGALYTVPTAGSTHTFVAIIRKAATGDRIMVFADSLSGTKIIDYIDTSPLPAGRIGTYHKISVAPSDAVGIHLGPVSATDPVLSSSLSTLPVGGHTTPVTFTAVGTSWQTVAPAWTIAATGGPSQAPTMTVTVTSDTTATAVIDAGNAAAGATVTVTETTNGLIATMTMQATSTLAAGNASPISTTWREVILSATAPTGGTGSYSYRWHESGAPLTLPGGANPPTNATAIPGATSLSVDDTNIVPSLTGSTRNYMLEVTDSAGNKAYSGLVTVVVPPPPTFATPTLSAGTPGLTSVQVTVAGLTGGVPPYVVKYYWRLVGGVRALLHSGAEIVYTVTGLPPGQNVLLSVDALDALGQQVTSGEIAVQMASPGVANAVTVQLPASGPQGWSGEPSAPFVLALGPVGGTVPGPVNMTMAALDGNGQPVAGAVFTPSVPTLNTGVSVPVTITVPDGTVGPITITATPPGGSGLAAPPAWVYTVMPDDYVALPMVVKYGPTASGQALGYIVVDVNSQVLIAHTTAGVSEVAGTGKYSFVVIVPWYAAGSVEFDAPAGQTQGEILVFLPSKPGPNVQGRKDAASNAAGLAAAAASAAPGTTLAQLQALLTVGVDSTGKVLLGDTARARLASDALAGVRFPLAIASGHATDDLEAALYAFMGAVLLASEQDTDSGVIAHKNPDGSTFLTRSPSTVGTKLIITPT